VVRTMAVTTRGILATSQDFRNVGHILSVDMDARRPTSFRPWACSRTHACG